MSAKDDFQRLAMMESVEVTPVGHMDQIQGRAPEWAELVLRIDWEDGRAVILPIRRHDGELIIECLHTVLHPGSSKSPLDRLWEQLDEVMDYLMVDDPEDEDKATARALATAIAMIALPYSEEPDVAAIKEQAVERWESRQ